MTERSNNTFDCTWYWQGGSIVGMWLQADAGKRDYLRNMGYVAHNGKKAIGAPEGPPSESEFTQVLSMKGRLNG